jgi:mRNA degradation ribonuclease J1/J2
LTRLLAELRIGNVTLDQVVDTVQKDRLAIRDERSEVHEERRKSSSSGLFQVTVGMPPPAAMARFVSRPDFMRRRFERCSVCCKKSEN